MATPLHQSAQSPPQHLRSSKHTSSLQACQHPLTFKELLSLGLTDHQRGNTGQDVLPVHFVSLQDLLQLADRLLGTERHEQLEEQQQFVLAMT